MNKITANFSSATTLNLKYISSIFCIRPVIIKSVIAVAPATPEAKPPPGVKCPLIASSIDKKAQRIAEK